MNKSLLCFTLIVSLVFPCLGAKAEQIEPTRSDIKISDEFISALLHKPIFEAINEHYTMSEMGGFELIAIQICRLNNDLHPNKPFEVVIIIKPWIEGFKGMDVIRLAVNPLGLGLRKMNQATEIISYEHEV